MTLAASATTPTAVRTNPALMRLGYPALGEAQTAPAAPPHGKGRGRAGGSAGEPQDRCASGGSKGDADEEAYWRRMYAEHHPDPAPFTAVLPTKEGHPQWGAPWCGCGVTRGIEPPVHCVENRSRNREKQACNAGR